MRVACHGAWSRRMIPTRTALQSVTQQAGPSLTSTLRSLATALHSLISAPHAKTTAPAIATAHHCHSCSSASTPAPAAQHQGSQAQQLSTLCSASQISCISHTPSTHRTSTTAAQPWRALQTQTLPFQHLRPHSPPPHPSAPANPTAYSVRHLPSPPSYSFLTCQEPSSTQPASAWHHHYSTTPDRPCTAHQRVGPRSARAFLDRVRLRVQAGAGGHGAVSYQQVARGRRLSASGGDGAPGGDVLLRCSQHHLELRGVPQFARAENGGAGGRNGRTGATGRDCVITVPVGTVVYELPPATPVSDSDLAPSDDSDQYADNSGADEGEADSDTTGEEEERSYDGRTTGDEGADRQRQAEDAQLVAELLVDGQEVMVARGGAGGRGNAALNTNPRPNSPPCSDSTPGEPGESKELLLELKLLADVGFVGMPNAGKSSLLAALTGARAKVRREPGYTRVDWDVCTRDCDTLWHQVAGTQVTGVWRQVGSYAFTTLHPQLGVIQYPADTTPPPPATTSEASAGLDGAALSPPRQLRRLTVADIPGLIRGAHDNRGRGNAFLRHVERVRVIVYVVDLSGGQEGSLISHSPNDQLEILESELRAYRQDLSQVPSVVVANKVDVCKDPKQALRALATATQHPIAPVSALHQAGLDKLKHVMWTMATTQGCAEP